MTDRELIWAIHRMKVETGSLACMGCGRENNCSIHGCAIIRVAADRLTAVLGELERVTRERDAAVECIQFIATYMELDSMKDIRKMIETWKADGRRRKREKDTHMQAVRVHEADRKSADYWQQPPGRAARRLYV